MTTGNNQEQHTHNTVRPHAEDEDHLRRGVYSVRLDKNTSMTVLIVFGVCAWLLKNYADNLQDTATTGKEQSTQALQQIHQIAQQQQQFARQLDALPDRVTDSINAAVTPVSQRIDDLRTTYSSFYTNNAAQRDKAEFSQTMSSIRQDINDNQNTIQTTKGRVDSLESAVSDISDKLNQIYQAVISQQNSSMTSESADYYDLRTGKGTPDARRYRY